MKNYYFLVIQIIVYPDMFTEKSCPMCSDKRISTVPQKLDEENVNQIKVKYIETFSFNFFTMLIFLNPKLKKK